MKKKKKKEPAVLFGKSALFFYGFCSCIFALVFGLEFMVLRRVENESLPS